MIRKIAIAVFPFFLAVLTCAHAQTAPPDPVRDVLVPPEVVMNHQQELGLTDAQRKAIVSDVEAAQGRFSHIQGQMEAAVAKLVDILRQSRVDQAKALAQLDAVLDVEREIKRAQLSVMIQVKNELTPEQQATAHKLESGAKP